MTTETTLAPIFWQPAHDDRGMNWVFSTDVLAFLETNPGSTREQIEAAYAGCRNDVSATIGELCFADEEPWMVPDHRGRYSNTARAQAVVDSLRNWGSTYGPA